jgi:hypothetical protein
MKISCKEDVYIRHTNFAKKLERNLHETTSRWKTYGKQLFSEDLEVRNEEGAGHECLSCSNSRRIDSVLDN